MLRRVKSLFVFAFIVGFSLAGFSRPTDIGHLKSIVQAFKKDPRGPYQGIRWFCADGTVLPPRERCPQPGGMQHALLKDVVTTLQQEDGIYLGQILAGTPFADFWDAAHQNSRVKQYLLSKYLQAVDDGWIMRRARFYRGAVQAEDEEAWGEKFLTWLVSGDEALTTQFFLCRQVAKDIPHGGNESTTSRIRALAKSIADSLQPFMDIRVKIHGKPDASDSSRVQEFHKRYRHKISSHLENKLVALERALASVYRKRGMEKLRPYVGSFAIDSPVGFQLRKVLQTAADERTPGPVGKDSAPRQCEALAHLLWTIRKNILRTVAPQERLRLLDISNEAEDILFRQASAWHPEDVRGLLRKNYILAEAAAGCGFFEIWEWENLEPELLSSDFDTDITLAAYLRKVNYSRRAVAWGTGMVKAVFAPVVRLYAGFEPLAAGFIDDRIRASILLPLGEVSGEIATMAARFSNLSNDVLGISSQNDIRGVNPGIAVGTLEVVDGVGAGQSFSADKIYILAQTPVDLKPVAGIATVSEGNAVSHVQLLARNLGIPNAVITPENLRALVAYSGMKVFYAVSPQGRVLMKPASEMTPAEKSMVAELETRRQKIAVPTDKVDLQQTDLLDLREVRATDSGRICGPKAANLGQLKSLFPDNVAAGFVIPFGIFRKHLGQLMPGKTVTYWQFLQQIFARAGEERQGGLDEQQVEAHVLSSLAELHDAIRHIVFLPGFKERLKTEFLRIFGGSVGRVPVFIRSDTNMEDLPDFTGAGLNLTVANIRDARKVFAAIRDVWASPFTERSYRWRQKYLKNPENVYPSLLVLQSVNAEKSGVMITTGVSSSDSEDVTVAFDWGIGGAVAGQAAETYLLRHDGADILLSPAREPVYHVLPPGGGVLAKYAQFHLPVLNRSERYKLRRFADEIRQKLPGTPGIRTGGPYDVELGFWNESIWLFQVRPFVENKLAQSSGYLNAMDSAVPTERLISLNEKIGAL